MDERRALLDENNGLHLDDQSSSGTSTASSSSSESCWTRSDSYSCSSCRSTTSSEEWETEVCTDGSLLYIEASQLCQIEEESELTAPIKQGSNKLIRWIRRRESTRRADHPTERPFHHLTRVQQIAVEISEGHVDSTALGFRPHFKENVVVIDSILPSGPLCEDQRIGLGDILREINGLEIHAATFEDRLSQIKPPCQVLLGIEKGRKRLTPKAELILRGNSFLKSKIKHMPLGIAVFGVQQDGSNAEQEILYAYPADSALLAARGAFLTLAHLLPSIRHSECTSCSCFVHKEAGYVIFVKEGSLLMLIAVPSETAGEAAANKCQVFSFQQASDFARDLVRSLLFNHQSLRRCFRQKQEVLDKLFSVTFQQIICYKNYNQLHDWKDAVWWVPLPREAQLQLDDALNEFEASNLNEDIDDGLENSRPYLIVGSCIYHRNILLSSHLPKDDLLDIHSLLRQHGLLDLMNTEGVEKLVFWREVFPFSVNRGFQSSQEPPSARWFLLAVATGHDLLGALLESGSCCDMSPAAGPDVELTREAEDTLMHIQRLGLTVLANQWLQRNPRPSTLLPRNRIIGHFPVEKQDVDQLSTTTTSQGNASETDENAPILGRRAERSRVTYDDGSGSSSSDSESDWGSYRNGGLSDGGNGLFENPYHQTVLEDLTQLTPTKITSGKDNLLFHYVALDGNDGIVMTPYIDMERLYRHYQDAADLLERFTRTARVIHGQFEPCIRSRSSENRSQSIMTIKEFGVLLGTKSTDLSYWVIGRLFFTPLPREVYVCYRDTEAMQNMVELAFRIALTIPG